MARQKLVSVLVSAVCFAIFTVVLVKGMAVRERHSFEASRALLDAGARYMTSQLAEVGADLPAVAGRVAADTELATQLHTLSQQIATLALLAKPGERMKMLVVTQTGKVSDRLSGLRGDLTHAGDVDAVALLDEQGLVLVSDSPIFVVGNRVRLPQLEAQTGPAPSVQSWQRAPDGVETIGGSTVHVRAPSDDAQSEPATEERGTDGRRAIDRAAGNRAAEERAAPPEPRAGSGEARTTTGEVRAAPAPELAASTMDELQSETVRAAITSGPSRGSIVVDGNIVHLGAAPLILKGKLAGILLVERRLRALPQPTDVDAVLAIGEKGRLGVAPEGVSLPLSARTDSAFLVQARAVRSLVPSFGAVGISPFFVNENEVGVWGRRFEVPHVPSANGIVYTDLTPAYAELGGSQIVTIMLAFAVFAVQALLIGTSGFGLMRGIAGISDF